MQLVLTPELMIEAYRQGVFPMAYNAGSPYVHWICPEMRGQLSITDMHIPRRLVKTLRRAPYRVTVNEAFERVISSCAQSTLTRPETWINEPIKKVCLQLHKTGNAHSIECWQDEHLVGGIYGISIGAAFFGESMFSRARDASKIALVHLAARLWKGGFSILDTQFVNEHLRQFGAFEMPHSAYKSLLQKAVEMRADFILKGEEQSAVMEEYLSSRGF